MAKCKNQIIIPEAQHQNFHINAHLSVCECGSPRPHLWVPLLWFWLPTFNHDVKISSGKCQK